jgi:para-nitrobenzyl esterase
MRIIFGSLNAANDAPSTAMERRLFLRLTAAATAGGLMPRLVTAQTPPRDPVVTTALGRLRGSIANGVGTFKGVPYGASTAGANRFMPPVKPAAWTGVREATAYGPRSPQPFRAMIPEIGDALTGSGPMSEDCLTLNVWTGSTDRGANRPVMVWFHGGGQRTGSGNSIFYDGTELARKHGVVVVTVNHRLNVFGNLYLPDVLGGRFADSSNLGMRDLVQALEWVRDNIEGFGGNPRNVTIFGQSGGGGKTALLQAMPAAKGLFHRAIIMATLADTAITALEPAPASDAASQLLARLGVTRANADKLQQISQEELLAAVTGGSGRAGGQAGIAAPTGDLSLRITPVKDGRTIVVHPFEPVASPLTADIPILCGSNETEGVPYGNPNDAFWKGEVSTDDQLRAQLTRTLRVDSAEADRLIALYRSHRPADSVADLALVMAADNSPLRLSAYTIAERKVAQGRAPVYMYFFQWRSPVNNGKLRSMHTMELPFVFDHVDDIGFMTGTGADRYPLAEAMAAAWAAFARSGDPNHDGLPRWPAFTEAERATMIFNRESRTVNDPYREERLAMQALRARRARANGA